MTNIFRSSVLKVAAVAVLAALSGCGPDDGEAEFRAGKAAFDAGDRVKAGKLFAKCVELAPDNVDALVYLARIKLAIGELPEAGAWIGKAEAIAPGDVDVRLLSAQIAWHLKDYDKAASLYKAIAEDASLDASLRADGWTGLGIVEMTRGEAHLARVDFLRAIRTDGNNAAARYHPGLVYREAPFGYLEAARDQFDIFVRLDKDASPRVQKTLNVLIPGLKESIARAEADRPGVARRNSAQCATAISKADAAAKKGAWKTARQCYQEALDADALSYRAALGLAKSLLKVDASKAGQGKALEKYKLACTLSPGAVTTFLEAGELASKIGMYGQAVEIYSRAVAANPVSLSAIDGLIKALRKVGGRQKEAAAYQSYRDFLSATTKKK